MAHDTDKTLKNKLIYEVYVRNHGKTGTFKDVFEDLDRIKELGADVIWFMPIHPIGEVHKKGSLGCPYSIRDYTAINPEYGTEDEFKTLIDAIHQKGMLCMIDVVFNHTSHDACYLQKHPEYYFRRADGELGNKMGDWYDVIDLDYQNKGLWEDQLTALKKWARFGVDGYRCDVASFVPVEFWVRARQEITKINSNFIWLAETVHPTFLMEARKKGVYAASDCEMYAAFDMTYDYDTHAELLKYLRGECTLEDYLEKKRMQDYIYPNNYIKLRYLENHDQPRAKKMIPNDCLLRNWTAFVYFEKGTTLIYAGQEALDDHSPSLFDRDPIHWDGLDHNFTMFLKKLAQIKKDALITEGYYTLHKLEQKGVICASYASKGALLLGIFNVEGKVGQCMLPLVNNAYQNKIKIPNGVYNNLVNDQKISIEESKLWLAQEPIIIKVGELAAFEG